MLTKTNRIEKALTSCGLTWSQLSSQAQAIILFGSEAANCSSRNSDVDLICVGDGKRAKSRSLHLIWLKPQIVFDPLWTKTELGGHVAMYGVWLKGENILGPPEPVSTEALSRKTHLIRQRTEVLAEYWSKASLRFRIMQLTKLRRDVQRLSILRNGGVVPPTPMLDSYWRRASESPRRLIKRALPDDQCLGRLIVSLISRRSACVQST